MPNPPPEIIVVDFDAGNLRSVQRALEAVGQRARVTTDPRDVARAEALVLPGVGSAQDSMRKLSALGLVEPLREYAASGRPFLGVCVGMQLLFDSSEEGGGVECLGILPGVVRLFHAAGELKVPQIGWNQVWLKYDHPLLDGIPGGSYFYFVHSYYAEPAEPEVTLGQADYGIDFAAIVARENVVATQFHPEKSADLGLRLYRNFGRIAARAAERDRLPAHSGR
ncbi:MAG TPA: imidazole glycerol phosphate synthase subunit HisH [Chloroflexota bacterium]|nr:imidazole glycerol phosphate synthase subunit HisH [Chloroflexota bacterium]